LQWTRQSYNPAVRTSATIIALSFISGWCAAQSTVTPAPNVDRVLVLKKDRALQLISSGKILKSYKVALGGDAVGPKARQGDHKTPEGGYVLDRRNPHSQFYKSIHVSYPNAQDKARAAALGVSPGGDIFVHGLPNGFGWLGRSHRLKDWTDGCIAVTDQEMDEIWKLVPDGTPIEIRP
jgi:murein L,D-transpeptidase YafK